MNSNFVEKHKSIFEAIKHINDYDQEYWLARELQEVLEYSRWEKFLNVIEKAKLSCENSAQDINDHFHQVVKKVSLGSNASREINDFQLSRYACYLIVQNSDPSKEIVALGQTYFATQTRKQELNEELLEDKKRLFLRNEVKIHNKKLAEAAKESGVITSYDYSIFQNHGYKGLYGGLSHKDIHSKKKLNKNQKILDYMGSTELAANLFRATQTEEKLRRENIQGKNSANKTHYEVGKKVRKTIEELGGTMPEDLPVAENIKRIKSKKQKKLD